MTNREKIMAIIKQANDELHSRFVEGVMRVRNGEISRFTTRDVKPYDDMLADMLIEAGIGDCAALTEKWRAMLETQAKKTEEAEHRAEVAEKALRNLVQFCAKSARFYLQSDKAVKEREQELYDEWIAQSEKDLAEERENAESRKKDN